MDGAVGPPVYRPHEMVESEALENRTAAIGRAATYSESDNTSSHYRFTNQTPMTPIQRFANTAGFHILSFLHPLKWARCDAPIIFDALKFMTSESSHQLTIFPTPLHCTYFAPRQVYPALPKAGPQHRRATLSLRPITST